MTLFGKGGCILWLDCCLGFEQRLTQPQANAASQLVGSIPQRPTAMAERMEDGHISKSSAMIRTGRRFLKLRPANLFGEPIQWLDATRSLGVTLDMWIYLVASY